MAITPFTLFYVIPYLFGAMPSPAMKVTVLSLGLLPLTFGYAIVRYRLMDVDLVRRHGLHAGRGGDRGIVLRRSGLDGRTGACAHS